jgi:hypothetical protein
MDLWLRIAVFGVRDLHGLGAFRIQKRAKREREREEKEKER